MTRLIDSFQSFAAQFRPEVEVALDQYTESMGDPSARLVESVRYSLLAPGKRLRPLLVLMATQACGAEPARAMPAAAAVEMVHAYSLIHDDLPAMDNDALRRGRPTCHRAFDEATAILAGDALLTLAFGTITLLSETITQLNETIGQLKTSAEVVVRSVRLLTEAAGAAGMVGGQADDIYAERGLLPDRDKVSDLELLYKIHRNKTGAMIRVSLEIGGTIAGATPDEMAALKTYGDRLGLAFQITDDLLDVCGDESATGKQVGKDEMAGKLTFPGLLGIDQARSEAERLTQEASDAVTLFGEAAEPLASLARYVLERDH